MQSEFKHKKLSVSKNKDTASITDFHFILPNKNVILPNDIAILPNDNYTFSTINNR